MGESKICLRYSLVLLEIVGRNDHEVKFNISFRAASELCSAGSPSISNASLYVDYIYLDSRVQKHPECNNGDNYIQNTLWDSKLVTVY